MTNLSAANKLRYDLSGKAALVTGAALPFKRSMLPDPLSRFRYG